mgnify:CR=1 FL=1
MTCKSKDQKLIEEFQTEAPIKVVSIAKALGVRVLSNKNFPRSLSGLIRCVDGAFEIYVNSNHPASRQRFTIAHELGHYMLHRDRIGDGIIDDYLYRSELTDSLEHEANQYAARLLMPEALITQPQFESLTLAELANEFWVSNKTMDIRLGELGLIV